MVTGGKMGIPGVKQCYKLIQQCLLYCKNDNHI